jgi:glycosyltransferase involved in cell wall biosynthesis
MKESVGKRVLMILENTSFPQDGRVRREAKTLTTAGYMVMVICSATKEQPRQENVDGVHVYRYPAPPDGNGFLGYLLEYGYSLIATFLISLLIALREGFDIIHAHNPPDVFVILAIFYKLFGKQFVFDHHDLSPEMYNARFKGSGNLFVYQALLFFEKLTFWAADHVITTNQSYKNIAMNRGGVPEENVSIVRNGPELSRVQPVNPDPELRKRASTIIGYVGVMGFQDGVDYLIRAISHLVNLGRDDFYCIIIGKGDSLSYLKALTAELRLQSYIWFTGRISDADLVRYLSTADICVDPDPSNPFNDRSTMIKMMEYMALGKPIVAFDLPEHKVTAQSAAIYATSNDELDFACKVAWLMDNPEQCKEMGKIGRERIVRELAWMHQEKNLLSAYASLSISGN